MEIPLAKPDIREREIKEVVKVLKTSYLSLGPKLKELEKKLTDFTGRKYAIAANSGTSALHLIIQALGIKDGDEVITTPFSFIASTNCLLYERAKPVFADIKSDTFNINPELVEKLITSKTKAILAVDVFGQSADWQELEKIAKKHKLFLIEDSAEALGSEYKGRRCGSFGDAAIFSFYPNKQIIAGEGGIILTNNKNISDLCRSMANQGRKTEDGKWLEHIRLGYNYRLDELSCALAVAQFGRLERIIKKREAIARIYNKKLSEISELETPVFSKNRIKLSRFVYVVKLARNLAGKKKDKIISEMAKKGIQCGNYFYPIHLQPFYKKELGFKKGICPVAENIGERTLALPFFNNLTEKEIDFVVKSLKEIINKIK